MEKESIKGRTMDQAWKDAISEGLKRANGAMSGIKSAISGPKKMVPPVDLGPLRRMERASEKKGFANKVTGAKLKLQGNAIMAGRGVKAGLANLGRKAAPFAKNVEGAGRSLVAKAQAMTPKGKAKTMNDENKRHLNKAATVKAATDKRASTVSARANRAIKSLAASPAGKQIEGAGRSLVAKVQAMSLAGKAKTMSDENKRHLNKAK